MTHIENGIYDNSLATDKINPSGTATTTAEIEAGQITDVIGFKSLKLKGQTSQYTTTGKNLMNLGQTNSTQSGVACAIDRATVKLNGTTTGSLNVLSPAVKSVGTFPAGTYVISTSVLGGTVNLGSRATAYYLRNTSTTGSDNIVATGGIGNGETQKTFTLSESTELFFQMYGNGADIAFSNYIFAVQIENGSTKTSFEQYTGGKASPSPDFPQEVNNVSGYNVIEISNVNKLPYAQSGSHAVSGMTHTSNGKGTYTLNGTATANSGYNWEIEPYTIKNGDYLYFCNSATASNVSLALINDNDTQIMYAGPVSVNRVVSLNSYAGQTIKYVRTYSNAQTLTNFVLKPMICTTTTVSSFVEHQGNNFEINLGKNLIQDETFVQGSYLDNTSTTRISCRNAKLKANTTYMISSTLNYSNYNVAIVTSPNQFPLTNSTSVKYDSGWKNANFSFTTGNDDVYINIAVKKLPEGVTITPNDVAGIKFQIEKGAIATPYAPYFPPIYIGKIGTYCNDIRKYNGKWYWHKEIGRKTLNGSETWTRESTNTSGKGRFQINLGNLISNNIVKPSSNANVGLILSDLFITVVAGTNGTYGCHEGISLDTSGYVQIYDETQYSSDVATFKTWLANNNTNLYWVYATPIDEEITCTPLIRQLDELYNSGLYDVTNISQDNSSEAFILDFEACKNNINGIVEYIRR